MFFGWLDLDTINFLTTNESYMNKNIFIIALIVLSGCAQSKVYKPNALMTQQQKDEAACDVIASNYRNQYFPNNPMLNAQGRREQYDLCMQSKGYSDN